jgi:anaerobic ribonucleoside-triphosphate reductase activating protein
MKIRLAAYLQSDSIVDGEGIRTVIWTQGCPHHCLGCHNPETQDFKGGALVEIDEVKKLIDELVGQDGITFSGGDPFFQPGPCSILAEYIKSKGMNVWCYTGWTYEELINISKDKKEVMDFLKQIDVLVDGRFVLEKKSYNCIFRGSTNQRIIDVPQSLKKKKVVLVDKYIHQEKLETRKRPEGLFI